MLSNRSSLTVCVRTVKRARRGFVSLESRFAGLPRLLEGSTRAPTTACD